MKRPFEWHLTCHNMIANIKFAFIRRGWGSFATKNNLKWVLSIAELTAIERTSCKRRRGETRNRTNISGVHSLQPHCSWRTATSPVCCEPTFGFLILSTALYTRSMYLYMLLQSFTLLRTASFHLLMTRFQHLKKVIPYSCGNCMA